MTIWRSVQRNTKITREIMRKALRLTPQHKEARLLFARSNMTTQWDKGPEKGADHVLKTQLRRRFANELDRVWELRKTGIGVRFKQNGLIGISRSAANTSSSLSERCAAAFSDVPAR
ncbi:hypothetical protein ANCCAN_01140 [Ancylostoma caninum]|uniref:Uncharacterized protein n=1 Tax=Ancylostoma caninum TaxID=29170 RepID=A0A368H831_ANCCA|nr:hypothetical protein ANCCAN_01140 [Ancylostoma caninum]